jgi:dihydroxy-acid dehydratase
MYTANTMASAEALGMSLPGSAAPPAVDRRRDARAQERHGGEMLRQHHGAQDPHQGGIRECHAV